MLTPQLVPNPPRFQKSLMAFRALKQQDGVVFQHVSDEMLGALLLLLR